MAETRQIEIKFNAENKEHPFGLPEIVEVKKGTVIEWVIKDPIVFENIYSAKRKYRRGIKFTVYFDKTSAFEWKSESLMLISFPRIPFPFLFPKKYPIRIASGTADNEGDHKYGMKLRSIENDNDSEPDYDDDPYLRVY